MISNRPLCQEMYCFKPATFVVPNVCIQVCDEHRTRDVNARVDCYMLLLPDTAKHFANRIAGYLQDERHKEAISGPQWRQAASQARSRKRRLAT